MSKKEIDKMEELAAKCLREAVREEVQKKALLGQYVVIMRNGRACNVPAKEALKMCKKKQIG